MIANQEEKQMGLFGFLGKKENENVTAPENDTEKWITATYAMWSDGGNGDWHYIAGSSTKSRQEAASMRVMLRRDWEVSNKAALLDMVCFLTALYAEGDQCEEEDIKKAAWDLCRACQILGMGYVGGYIDRQEMVQESVKVCQIMRKYFHSWKELYDSYLIGYKEWRTDEGENAEEAIAARESLCKKLLELPDGPCTIDWNLAL